MSDLPRIACRFVRGTDDADHIAAHWLVPATARSRESSEGYLRMLGPPRLDVNPASFDDPPFQPTALSVSRTDSGLFFRFVCADRDIWGTYTKRDEPLYDEEVVEVFLCPTGDPRHYYEFEVSPRNVAFDAKVFSPDLHRRSMQVDTSWDCPGLETKVTVDGTLDNRTDVDRSWTAEFTIPFIAFPEVEPPKPGDSWRANFYRIDRADPPEFSAWSPTGETPANFHVPERFGYLDFE